MPRLPSFSPQPSSPQPSSVINSDLDVRHWHDELARRGRAQIESFLQPEAAAFLSKLLRDVVPWTLAYRRDGVSKVMPHAELAETEGPQSALGLRNCRLEKLVNQWLSFRFLRCVGPHPHACQPSLRSGR